MMDLEEDYLQYYIQESQKRQDIQNENVCMFEVLVEVLSAKSNLPSILRADDEQYQMIKQQYSMFSQQEIRQARVKALASQQFQQYQQYKMEERLKKQQNQEIYGFITERQLERERQLKEIQQAQYSQQNNTCSLDIEQIDNQINNSSNPSQIQAVVCGSSDHDNTSFFDNNLSYQNNVLNTCNNSSAENIFQEEDYSNDFPKISNQNHSSNFDNTSSSNYVSDRNNQQSSLENNYMDEDIIGSQKEQQYQKQQQYLDQHNSVRHLHCNGKYQKNNLISSTLQLLKRSSDDLDKEKQNGKKLDIKVELQTTYDSVSNYQKSSEITKIKPQNPQVWDQRIQLCGGLLFQDGVLRNQKGLIHISFGFQQEQIVRVESKKKINVISVQMQPEVNAIEPPVEEAISILENCLSKVLNAKYLNQVLPAYSSQKLKDHMNASSLGFIKEKLSSHMRHRQQFKDIMKSFIFDQNILKWKDENFNIFVDRCNQYLEEYDQAQNKMYQYSIFRFNYLAQDVQIYECGYSKPYLNLLGIDDDTFSAMMMRGQKIDLIKHKDVIHQQTLYSMIQCLLNVTDIEMFTEIHTFDGFSLNLHQKQNKICIPCFQQDQAFEYMFFITEMDVSMNDLQSLIMYRQRISQQNQQLSYDEFVRKELSYLFEDVEYSVHSQSFIEKYYSGNLEQLQNLNVMQRLKLQRSHPQQEAVVQDPLKPVQYNFVSLQ